MEFLHLGIGSAAEPELRKIGLSAPPVKSRVTDSIQIEKLCARAFLYDRAVRFATARWSLRWYILDYREKWPVGANRARLQLESPYGSWEFLNRHAALNHVPPSMQ